MPATRITRDDVLPMHEYGAMRDARRKEVVAMKKNRRVALGPDATFTFESYETMWLQIHEMLFIEKGGEEQIPDELNAYNTLIPQGRELVATLMFEIDNPERRAAFLAGLGGVEETVFIDIDGAGKIFAKPEVDVDRTSAAGKASSVQFLHFPFTAEQVMAFRNPNARVLLGIEHPKYPHVTVLQPEVKAELGRDFA